MNTSKTSANTFKFKCHVCGKTASDVKEKMIGCSRCDNLYYCSEPCKDLHYQNHPSVNVQTENIK